MQSSEGVRNLLQDQHLLDRPRPSTSMGVRSRTTRLRRPLSAPPTQPQWRNPNSPEMKKRRKFHVKYSASGKIKKQGANVLYKVMVKTGNKKNCGTDAKVFCEFCGVYGKFRRHLTHQVEPGVPAAFVATLPPFVYTPGAKDMFNIKGPDIGEMRHITIEHDGKDRKQGWFLEEVAITNNKTEQKYTFPCNQWLSLYEHDCAVSRRLKPVIHRKPVRTVYVIEVETGDKAGAGTDAHVFITLFGKNGKTPKTQLINRNENTFERNRTDVFKIKITELGPLSKLIVEHDNFGFSAGWYLNKIIVYERENAEKKYYFPCYQWLATDEGDGRIVRDLTATTDSKSGRQGILHSYI
ncbi:hypothetical protein QZH41_017695 [Actinostola sp. cb2023]|nr:hypothetical protein QZH41_017695 [Actinostola sp. cb2023]